MDSDPYRLFFAFWWLIFPIFGFLAGALGMWFTYRRQKDALDLMRIYAEQGKDPAEIAKILNMPANGPLAGPGPYWGGPWGWGWGSRWGPWGPFREWRRFIIFTCLAVGFGVASQWAEFPGTERAFTLVAIIMGVLAAGSLLFAIVSTIMFSNSNKNDR